MKTAIKRLKLTSAVALGALLAGVAAMPPQTPRKN